jgi:hypothetical protein
MPSGAAVEVDTHYHHYGFAYEEWNFDFTHLVRGWKYGWIEGFWIEPDPVTGRDMPKRGRSLVPFGTHDVALYTFAVTSQGRFRQWVGRIKECEHIRQLPPVITYNYQQLANRATQANNAGANVQPAGANAWQYHDIRPRSRNRWPTSPFVCSPNIRFKPSSYVSCQNPSAAPVTYNHYGPLLVDGSRQYETIWDNLPPELR